MNLPNKISIARIILVPFFIACIVYSRMDIALIIFLAAVVSDGLDGLLARARNEKTKFGTIIDPLADKMLLVSAFICLSIVKSVPPDVRLPPYVPIIVISRDAILVIGAILVYVVTGDINVKPSIAGKITTFFQMMTIVSILVGFKYAPLIWNVAVVMTVISAVDYINKGSKLFNENSNHTKKAP
jgi:cardiolipin synthase